MFPSRVSKATQIAVIGVVVLGMSAISTQAAPCCGGTSASPAWISGDDRVQAGFSISRSTVIGDAPEAGLPVFRSSSTSEATSTARVDLSALITDRIQASLLASITQKSLSTTTLNAKNTQLGDPTIGMAYEAWPEWNYSEWKPRGFLFGQLTLPLAKSIYDSTDATLSDATGSGFTRLSFGALLLKTREPWDFSLTPEIYRGLARRFNALSVDPGFGASALVALGYHLKAYPWRLGFRLQPVWNQGRRTESEGIDQVARSQWVWNTGLDLSILASSSLSVNLNYTDQTLFGPAINTTLSRTVALGIQRRWPR
ncbi:hypothetical protein EBZ37_03455 [bacterium]|nr:hypothetical protein [bacterium]